MDLDVTRKLKGMFSLDVRFILGKRTYYRAERPPCIKLRKNVRLIRFSETMVQRKTSQLGPQSGKNRALTLLNIDHGSKLVDYKPDNLVRLSMTLTSGAPGTWCHPGN